MHRHGSPADGTYYRCTRETDGHVPAKSGCIPECCRGVKLDEPAIDLAVAISIASSFRDISTKPYDVFFGEVGLTGEVRGVSRAEMRVKEAAKLGFRRVIMPEKSMKGWKHPQDIQIIGVSTVADALSVALD